MQVLSLTQPGQEQGGDEKDKFQMKNILEKSQK